jgi:hypothetical protein
VIMIRPRESHGRRDKHTDEEFETHLEEQDPSPTVPHHEGRTIYTEAPIRLRLFHARTTAVTPDDGRPSHSVVRHATRREQFAAACELLRNPNDPGRLTFRQVGTFLGGLNASAVEGQDRRTHELLLPPERPSVFPKKSGTGSRQS